MAMRAASIFLLLVASPHLAESRRDRIIGADGEVHQYGHRKPKDHNAAQPQIHMLNAPLSDQDYEQLLLGTGISMDALPDIITDAEKKGRPVIDGINYMRAEICAKMVGKHSAGYKAYDKCLSFMRGICHPGQDGSMDGGKKETTTMQGWCRAFFPPPETTTEEPEEPEEKEEEEEEEEVVEKKTRSLEHKTSYDNHPGVMLGKPIEGHDETLSPKAAEKLCEELGDVCAGYTCDKSGKECTVRAPGTLKDCVKGSLSFVKPSFDPESFKEEEDGDDDDKDGDKGGGDDGADKSDWDREKGQMLGEPIPGETTERGVRASQEACEKMGDKCAGFTCDKHEKKCTLRGPGNLVSSDNGEVSYIKPASKDKGSSSDGDDGDGDGGNVIAHMDESKGAASQGFYGHKVQHDDKETFTGDWQKEFGPNQRGEKNVHDICSDHPDNDWCIRHGRHRRAQHSGAFGLHGASALLAYVLPALLGFSVAA